MLRDRAIWLGLAAQLLQAGAVLLLLPFVVTHLSPTEVGVWYLFATMQGLATLVDFGFQPTFSRAFSAAHGGATVLLPEGLAAPGDGGPNIVMLGALVRAARTLYAGLAGLAGVLLVTIGLWYLARVADAGIDWGTVVAAWLVFAAGIVLNLYFLWIAPLFVGTGRIGASYLTTIVARGSFAATGIIAVLAGGGLIGLAVASLVSVVAARLVAGRPLRGVVAGLSGAGEAPTSSVLAPLWPNAARSGVVGLGAFLITRYTMFVVTSYQGLAAAGAFAVSFQLLSAVGAVAQLPLQVSLPRLVQLRQTGDWPHLRRQFGTAMLLFLVIMLGGAAVVVAAGEPLLRLVGSDVRLLDRPVLVLMALVLLLEYNHSSFAFLITTGNRVPFVWPAVLSGIGVAVLATLAGRLGLDIWAIIASQGLTQLAYNNWKWPLMAWRELHQDKASRI